ncbi:MAG: NifB/NifX family molybdenum-iron cluster-binding protein [Prolixibacteraceae bacterium]
MSKFAITSTGKTGKSFLDLRFGKCKNVALYDKSDSSLTVIENPFKDVEHSGIHLIKYLRDEGVTAVITGEVGPMVSNELQKEKMQLILLDEEKIKINDVIAKIK